jgi:transcriptional regulator of acetoin/glycerol metabolism
MTTLAKAEAVLAFERLGERRQELQRANDELAQDIRQALQDNDGLISKSLAAQLLGMDRAGLYKTYLTTK